MTNDIENTAVPEAAHRRQVARPQHAARHHRLQAPVGAGQEPARVALLRAQTSASGQITGIHLHLTQR